MKVRQSSSRILLFLVLISLGVFYSCKKERFNTNNTGKNVLSEEDLLNLNLIDTTITIYSYPVLADSVKTDEVSSEMLLGSYIDPKFGMSKASLYSQFVYSSPKDFSTDATSGDVDNLTVDSVILSMPISSIYGTTEDQIFEVYQLNEQLSIDEDYYSNQTLTTSPTNLVEIGKETITPSLTEGKIDLFLSTTLGDDIIDNAPTTSESDYLSWFKGLYITTNNTQTSGEGSIISIKTGSTSDSTTLTIYYHDISAPTEVLSFETRIDESTARFNNFSHDYSGTIVESALNDKSLGDDEFYVQAMGGINSEIEIPFIQNLNAFQNIVIRKAELILPYQEDGTYDKNESLIPLRYNEAGELAFLIDQFIENVGGLVNSTDKNFVFNITNHLNQIITGDIADKRILIAPVGSSVVPNRTIFNGQSSVNQNKIELKISYSTF